VNKRCGGGGGKKKDGRSDMLNGKVKKKKNSDIHKILETLVVKVLDDPSLKGVSISIRGWGGGGK